MAARRRSRAATRTDAVSPAATVAAPAVWQPAILAAWCFVFPPAGALLYYLNLRAIGAPTKGLVALAVIIVGTVLVVALPIVLRLGLPPNTVALLNVVSLVALYYDWRGELEGATRRRVSLREAPWFSSIIWALPVTLIGYGAIAAVILILGR